MLAMIRALPTMPRILSGNSFGICGIFRLYLQVILYVWKERLKIIGGRAFAMRKPPPGIRNLPQAAATGLAKQTLPQAALPGAVRQGPEGRQAVRKRLPKRNLTQGEAPEHQPGRKQGVHPSRLQRASRGRPEGQPPSRMQSLRQSLRQGAPRNLSQNPLPGPSQNPQPGPPQRSPYAPRPRSS